MANNNAQVDPTEALLAGRASGRSFVTQVLDLVRFMLGKGKMRPQDYFYYALFDDDLYTDEERQRFISDGYAPAAIMKPSQSFLRLIMASAANATRNANKAERELVRTMANSGTANATT